MNVWAEDDAYVAGENRFLAIHIAYMGNQLTQYVFALNDGIYWIGFTLPELFGDGVMDAMLASIAPLAR